MEENKMNNIISISTYETIQKNYNGFYDTIDIIYNVLFSDAHGNGKSKIYRNNEVPDFVLDFIDACIFYHESYFKTSLQDIEQREITYVDFDSLPPGAIKEINVVLSENGHRLDYFVNYSGRTDKRYTEQNVPENVVELTNTHTPLHTAKTETSTTFYYRF